MENRSPHSLFCLLAFFAVCGCSGQAFGPGGVAPIEMGDVAQPPVPSDDAGLPVGSGGSGGAGGARATGGKASGAATASGGGAATTGDATSTGGSSGDARAMGDAAGDAGEVCVTDLSGVGTGDFSIHFTLTTTESVLTLGLLNQRTGCDETSTFWDISLSPTGGVVAVTDDGTHRVFVEAGNSLNNGKPHKVDVIRRGGQLWYASDGTINSTPSPDPYAFGTFPPLVLGSSACAGTTPLAGHATISEVCITET